jgi:uncharacterized protein (DUF3820 family)
VGSLFAAALARAQGFLLAPAAETSAAPAGEFTLHPSAVARPLRVAVIGLTRRSGATLVACGLAHALAVAGVRESHLLTLAGEGPDRAARAAAVTRWELPPALREPAEVAEYGETVGRLAGGPAALVWDFSAADSGLAGAAIRASDCAVAVASGSAEPALAALVCSMLAERVGDVLLVANRVLDPDRWRGRCLAALPESRLGAFTAARGRMPGGELGLALRRLAAAVEESS